MRCASRPERLALCQQLHRDMVYALFCPLRHDTRPPAQLFPIVEVLSFKKAHRAVVFLHRRVGGHTVEELELLTIALDKLAAAFVMAGQHTTGHDKVGTSAERLREVAFMIR